MAAYLRSHPVVCIEGPDGSGKSTLVSALITGLRNLGMTATTLPRLGHYLPTGDDAQAFREWIRSTPTGEANRLILSASETRLRAAERLSRSELVIMDRGPITIEASCLARELQSSHRTARVFRPLRDHWGDACDLLFIVLLPQGADSIAARIAHELGDAVYRTYFYQLVSVFLKMDLSQLEHLTVDPTLEPALILGRSIRYIRTLIDAV
jgi:predicted ATPase